MMWDEEVAMKEKVCPMTLRISEDSRFRSHNCMGSKCMAWRGAQSFTLAVQEFGKTPVEGKYPETEIPVMGKGFCGLAGPPGRSA